MRDKAEMTDTNSPRDIPPKTYWTIFAVLMAAAAFVRLPGIYNDFWLDEIWNYAISRNPNSALDILRIHIDANHILNTLWMYWLGDLLWWPAYRIPSLLAGIGSVALAGFISSKDGNWESLTAVFLAGASHILILYSSEARGYALVIFFALAAFFCMERYLESGSLRAQMLMSLCVSLGFLAHLVFFHCYISLAVWSLYHWRRRQSSWLSAARCWAQCHAFAGLFLAWLYWGRIRHMTHADAPRTPAPDLLRQTIAAVWGAPATQAWALLLGLAVLLVTLDELRRLHKKGSDTWVFYGIMILISPMLFIVINPVGFLFPRYFLINISVFLLLLGGFLVHRLLRGARIGKILFAAVLAVFAWGNGGKTSTFYKFGRGQYLATVKLMAAETSGDTITVGSENEFAWKMTLRFYGRYLPPDKRIVYYPRGSWTAGNPQWAIVDEYSSRLVPSGELTASNGSHYLFRKEFLYSDHAGSNWFLYRLNESGAPERPHPG
jgi:hypothetical protein